MKNSLKHLLCAATVLVVFVIGSCHKDNALTSTDKSLQDSLHRIDSLHAADSVDHIRMGIDSASGKYWCEHRYSFFMTDSLLGYDTVTVSRGAGATIMVVNGETFVYKSNVSYYPVFSNGEVGWGTSNHLSYVQFNADYSTITYMKDDSHISGATGDSKDFYRGARIH